MKLYVNGQPVSEAALNENKLYRAVLISLFTWRRAEPSDDTDSKWGWWGDGLSDGTDEIGSRLYLCLRNPLTDETVLEAQEYAEQSLQWMLEDKIASAVSVRAERNSEDVNRLDMVVTITADEDYQITFKELGEYVE